MTVRKAKSFSLLMSVLMLSACAQTDVVQIRPVESPYLAGGFRDAGAESDFYAVGKAYLREGSYGLAIDSFRRSLQESGQSVAVLNGLGITYDMLGRFDLSQKYYEMALDLDPRSPITLSNLAYSQHLQGEDGNAIKLAAAAEELSMARDEAAAAAEVFQGNREIAAQSDADSLIAAPVATAPGMAIERISEREWQQVAAESETRREEGSEYRANISLDEVLNRIRQKDVAQEVSVAESVAAVQPAIGPSSVSSAFRVVNGTGKSLMARRMANFMGEKGLNVKGLANARTFDHETSVLKYLPGHEEQAREMANLLPVAVELVEQVDLRADVELTLGRDLLEFDGQLLSGVAGI